MSDPPEHDRPLPPPPVEPLPDLAWARLERQLWQTLDTPVEEPAPRARFQLGRWRYPLIGALSVAAAVALAVLWPREPAPSIGTAQVQPSRVATTDAATQVSFGDAEITVAPRSTLLLAGDERRGVELYLERGRAHFEVAPRQQRPPFVVRAGAVRVTVVGTAFTVARDGDEVQVEVQHGVVEVIAGARLDRVSAGQLWDHDGVRAGTLAALEIAPPPPPPAPTALAPVVEDAGLVDDVAVASGSHGGSASRPAPAPAATAGSARPAHAPPTAPTPAPPALDPKAAFAAAAALESSDPAGAMTAYRKLAAGDGAWAANALYAAARLSLDRGDHATAAELARAYLARFPRGRNAADASALLERVAR